MIVRVGDGDGGMWTDGYGTNDVRAPFEDTKLVLAELKEPIDAAILRALDKAQADAVTIPFITRVWAVTHASRFVFRGDTRYYR